jgi:hypothetical protein
MGDRELILGVLATQAGFATPAQVMEAASAVLIKRDGTSLLERLETTGALTAERRALLEAMADAALAGAESRDDATHLETVASGWSEDEPPRWPSSRRFLRYAKDSTP